MDITPLTVFYGSMLGLIVAALFVVMYRQGRSPTYGDMMNLERQTRDELRAEIRETVKNAVTEITAEMNRQTTLLNHRIDETNQRIDETNQRIDRILTTLASHQHIDGRVMITVQNETEPTPAGDD
jgi:ribonuclease HII